MQVQIPPVLPLRKESRMLIKWKDDECPLSDDVRPDGVPSISCVFCKYSDYFPKEDGGATECSFKEEK